MIYRFDLRNYMGTHSMITHLNRVIALWGVIDEESFKDVSTKLIHEPKNNPLRRNEVSVGSFNGSNMTIEKNVRLDDVKAHAVMMISNLTSSKTGDIFNQYFLLNKNLKDGSAKSEEDLMNEIKTQFFNRNMKSLPIPIKQDWEEYFWDYISKSIERLNEIGNTPMVAYAMSLPDLSFLNRLIEKCHVKSEYKAFFKGNIPKIEALLAIGDVKGFDARSWKPFMTDVIKGKDELDKFPFEQQETIVRGFELFGNTPLILTNLNELHSSSLRPITMKIRNMKDEGKKKQYKTALRKILEEFSNKSSDLISIINNFDDLFTEHHQNIRNGNWGAIEKYLATIIYDNVSDGCRELAVTCGRVAVSKTDYLRYEEEYLDNIQNCLTAPKEYPTIEGKVEGSKVSWETIDMSDPRAWVVGIETYCCQHLGAIGGACVRYAAANPSTSGIFRVDEKGKTIAQSFFWLQESIVKGEYILVFDNIEVAGSSENGIRDSVLDAYKSFAKDLKKYVGLFRIRAITIGTNYMEDFLLKLATEDAVNENYAPIPQTLNYSDARTQKLFKEYKLKKVKS